MRDRSGRTFNLGIFESDEEVSGRLKMTQRASGQLPLFFFLLWVLTPPVLGVRRDQGIPDTEAYVGRAFRFHIPKDAFKGKVERYEVTEAGESGLPLWLHFDEKRLVLKGVPSTSDVGQLYICIKAIGNNNSTAKDVFSIEITDDSPISGCEFGKTETLASITLDVTLSDLKPGQKFRVLHAAAAFFNLPEARFRLAALRREDSSFDPAALRAGPGNALQRSHEGAQVLFGVGCSGAISPQFEEVLNSLEKSAANGELADALRNMVIGWQVSSGDEAGHSRDRRYVTPFRATPVPKVHVTRWRAPTRTQRIDESETGEVVPDLRIVPTMSSPRFDGEATTHRHRHGHGQDQLRREDLFPTTEIAASPSYHYHPFPTNGGPVGSTPVPTPVPFPHPDRSRVVVHTRIYDIESTASAPARLPTVVSEDVISRWYVSSTDFSSADVRPTRVVLPTVEPTRRMPEVPNFKPTVNNRIKKLTLVAGKAWRYAIPLDTFIDMEDGNTKDLKLMFMTSERTSLSQTSWIQFDPENQVIYALPLSDNVGKHEFVLEAMDSEGASTFDRVELHVWKHPQADLRTHSFNMTVRYNKWQYPVGIDWQIEVLNRLAQLFGDDSNKELSVLSVTLDPVKITWVNDSLPTEGCPVDEILDIYNRIATPEHQPTKEMRKQMAKEFRVQDINVGYSGACAGVVTTLSPRMNFPPGVNQHFVGFNVTVGDVIKYKIPPMTFIDFEDGPTRNLRLTLLTSDNKEPEKSYWLQLNEMSQELYGLPSDSEASSKPHHFLLTATDRDGQPVTDAFVIYVSRLPLRQKPPVEFSVQLEYDYDSFQSDTSKKTLLASKIARLYGDPDPRYILITKIARGSVVYAWSNKTLANDFCPREQIDRLWERVVIDGNLSPELIQVMEPEFKVVNANAVATGVCTGGVPPTFVTITTVAPPPSLPPEELEPTLKTSTDDDIYVTTIVPAIVIAVMLVIAAIVAYFLYWKKRKGKMSLGDKDFIGSGVPVVFAGELEEQKSDPGKTPAIMKNEKPPLSADHLLNPFRRAAVRDSAPSTGARDGPLHRERSKDPSSTLYKPPPPFASNRDVKSTRPKSTQAYRHATYVPP